MSLTVRLEATRWPPAPRIVTFSRWTPRWLVRFGLWILGWRMEPLIRFAVVDEWSDSLAGLPERLERLP